MTVQTRVHYGTSLIFGNNYGDEIASEDWCRFSNTCYKKRTKLHVCIPENGKPYINGCPKDSTKCEIAQMVDRVHARS